MDIKKTEKIGQKIGIKWGNLNIDPIQLKKGISIEAEHKDITKGNKKMQARIAMAHLKEDPKYYSKLSKMENTPKLSTKKKRDMIFKNLVKKAL